MKQTKKVDIEPKFTESHKKTLISRRMHKMLNKKLEDEAQSQLMNALEEAAISFKKKGVTRVEGVNYLLILT